MVRERKSHNREVQNERFAILTNHIYYYQPYY